MKTVSSIRSKAFKVAATGATLVAAQGSLMHETGSHTFAEVESKAVVSSPAKLSTAPIEATAQANEIVFDTDAEWDGSAKERFNDLSRKFALGRLTPAQTTEYENLKILRRRENPSRSFEQIKADIEFHQAVRAAIAGLQQLIDHGTRTFRAET
jgi:hypothetical protein